MKPFKEAPVRSRPPDVISISEFKPEKSGARKFVRVGTEIRLSTENGQKQPPHPDLVSDISDVLRELLIKDPSQVDAGALTTNTYAETIRLMGRSDTLNLPRPEHEKEAREGTAEQIRELFPNFTVLFDEDYAPPIVGDSGEADYAYFDITKD